MTRAQCWRWHCGTDTISELLLAQIAGAEEGIEFHGHDAARVSLRLYE